MCLLIARLAQAWSNDLLSTLTNWLKEAAEISNGPCSHPIISRRQSIKLFAWSRPGSREWSVSSDGAPARLLRWAGDATRPPAESRDLQNTQLELESRGERERERERCNCSEVGPGCYWATRPQPPNTRPDPGHRLERDRERQLAELWQDAVITDSDILASDTRWGERCEVQEYRAVRRWWALYDWESGPAPQPGPSLQRLPWTRDQSQ